MLHSARHFSVSLGSGRRNSLPGTLPKYNRYAAPSRGFNASRVILDSNQGEPAGPSLECKALVLRGVTKAQYRGAARKAPARTAALPESVFKPLAQPLALAQNFGSTWPRPSASRNPFPGKPPDRVNKLVLDALRRPVGL